MTHIESTTWLDLLPTEIIFIIFEYLSTNDIMYTFTDFSQRSKNLLLENERFLTTLVLPTTNLNIWKNIFTVIGPKIKSLIIESDELTIPLEYFPNLKSIVYFLPVGSSDEQIKVIVQSDQFHNLHSLKIKKDKSFSNELFHGSTKSQNSILDRIFNNKNSLEIFEYTILSGPHKAINTNNFIVNFNLHSLTLTLVDFNDIFTLIEYTPNLKYLNIYSQPPRPYNKLLNEININLKELHLKLANNILSSNLTYTPETYDGNLLIDIIKRFSSSLNNLSIIYPTDQFLFSIRKLQNLLKAMKRLEQFHLYAQIKNSQFDNNFILRKFEGQYWSFGMYKNYLFTLPFHFDYLSEFPNNFNNVQSHNPDILENNSQIWFNVKSLELSMTHQYDFNFVRELKIKIPKLNFITFKHDQSVVQRETEVVFSRNDDVTLNRVTTIQLEGGSMQQIKQWLIYSLPNVKRLILSWTDLSSIDNQIGQILNERIQQLNISDDFHLKNLIDINYVCFSNVECINFRLHNMIRQCEWHGSIIMKILKNFKNLKRLLIYPFKKPQICVNTSYETYSTKVLKCLNLQEIGKNYQIKYYENYCIFSKIFL